MADAIHIPQVLQRGLALAAERRVPEVGHGLAGRAEADQPDEVLHSGCLVVGEPFVRVETPWPAKRARGSLALASASLAPTGALRCAPGALVLQLGDDQRRNSRSATGSFLSQVQVPTSVSELGPRQLTVPPSDR